MYRKFKVYVKVPKVLEALSARIILLKLLIVPKAQTLTLAHFSSLYTLGTFYKIAVSEFPF